MELMRRGLQQRHRLFFLGFALVYFGKVRGGLHRRRGAQRAALAGPGGARGAVWCRRPPRRRPPRSPPPHQLRKGGGVGGGGGCKLTLVYQRTHAYAHVHEQMRQITLDGSNISYMPHPLDSLFLAPLARPLARGRHFCATFFFRIRIRRHHHHRHHHHPPRRRALFGPRAPPACPRLQVVQSGGGLVWDPHPSPGEGLFVCHNEGSCLAPEECTCTDGYGGFDCAMPLCRHLRPYDFFGTKNYGEVPIITEVEPGLNRSHVGESRRRRRRRRL